MESCYMIIRAYIWVSAGTMLRVGASEFHNLGCTIIHFGFPLAGLLQDPIALWLSLPR